MTLRCARIQVLGSGWIRSADSLYRFSAGPRLRDSEYVPYRQAKAKRKKSGQLRVLQSLPGVGPDRAKRLLERFGTVRACFGASTEEIMDVEGIGSKTAAAI